MLVAVALVYSQGDEKGLRLCMHLPNPSKPNLLCELNPFMHLVAWLLALFSWLAC